MNGRIKIVGVALCICVLKLSVAASPSGLEVKPNYLVYAPTQAADAYNDHFQVIWDGGRKLYYAFWTQATREGAPDMRVVFSKSADRGRTWTAPKTLAGTPIGAEPRPRGVWQQPMLAKGGRLYCLWNQQASAEALHHGLVYGRYSDDAGETWSEPEENKSIPRQPMDDPKGVQLPNWCNWQRPIRVGEGGRFMTGCTRHVKPVDVETSPGRPIGSWVEFWQYENIDTNPEVRDIRITVLNGGEKSLSIPIPGTDRFCCEEASLAKLPDGRLFALVRSRARHPFWSASADGGRTWTKPKPLRDRSGRAFLHPNSPCPMYDLCGCAAGSGTCFALVHDAYDDSIPPLGRQKRGPLYFLRGTFDPKGEQPVAFEKEDVFLPLETDNSCYSSYTVADGERVLWFGLRKHELVGRRIESPD